MEPFNNGKNRDTSGRFVHGNPGGPGRPKGTGLTDLLRSELEAVDEVTGESRAAFFIKKVLVQAEQGDKFSQKLIMNYIDGLPRQKVDMDIRTPQTLYELIQSANVRSS